MLSPPTSKEQMQIRELTEHIISLDQGNIVIRESNEPNPLLLKQLQQQKLEEQMRSKKNKR